MTGTININLRILASIGGGEESEVATAVAPIEVYTASVEKAGAYAQVHVTAPDAESLTNAIKSALCHCADKGRMMTEPTRSGWTSHGHPIPGATIVGPRPTRVARCGGTMLCATCKTEAMAAISKETKDELGMTTVESASERPEPILTTDQWGKIKGGTTEP